MSLRSCGGVVLALLAGITPLRAQTTLRVGGFSTSYADSLRGTAGSLGVEAAWSAANSRLTLTGAGALFSEGGWAVQGSGSAATLLAVAPRWGFGLSGDAEGHAIEGGIAAAAATAGPFVSVAAGRVVARASVAGGVLRHISELSYGTATGHASVSVAAGPWTAAIGGGLTTAGPVDFTDVAAWLAAELGAASLEAGAGYRAGDLGDRAWGQARLSVSLVQRIAVELGGGRYPADPAGFLHGTFLQAGLSLRLGGASRARARPAGLSFEVRDAGGGVTEVTVVIPGLERAGLAGEWNGWTPEPMDSLGGGRWRARLSLPPGAYRFVVVDSTGRWTLPDGAPRLADEFGSEAGLLVVR